ncbi:MAG TPA: acyloxyacyl hydrolase [Methylomirabilota bacterium]|nr:acyloxyacyl hydrolase [Methylomirabilota bacterium]
MKRSAGVRGLVVLVLLALGIPDPASAFDAEQTFAKGTFVVSGEGAYGWQFDLEKKQDFSAIEAWDVGVRFGLLPFETFGKTSPLYGSVEVGLEPLYQRYLEPQRAFWAGLAAVIRYHFLGLGRVVPYLELAGSAGGTDLSLPEIRSTFAFLLFGGGGASVFVDDRAAVYAGYRFQHVSNGNTSRPNRGFESHVGVMGFSFLF